MNPCPSLVPGPEQNRYVHARALSIAVRSRVLGVGSLRGFDLEQFHTIGIFTNGDEGWQELARVELGKEVDLNNAEPVPDFLGKGSVAQAY